MIYTHSNQILIFCFILLAAHNAVASEKQSRYQEFYSWYDGWGTHTVWGLGKVAASYSDAAIVCGNKNVPVTPIYDTHADHEPPKPEQASAHAENHNIELVKELKNKGITCALKDI